MKKVMNFRFTKNVRYCLRLVAFEGRTRFAEPVILRKKDTIEELRTTSVKTITRDYNRKLLENLENMPGKPISKAVLSRKMKGQRY
jgi:hypothetical protein